MKESPAPAPSSEEPPHVPLFRTWRAIYFSLLSLLAGYVIFLAVWSRWLE